eukprot:m.587633 g.587633  ORF g.587633 m.587633 type:complete len:687 (+) comp22355_c0_seq1:40-2100(+)
MFLHPGTFMLLLVAVVSAALGYHALEDQPYYPIFHIRPPSGHVNDPNGPFRDNNTGYVHLFMQYCPLGPCLGQNAPIVPGKTPNVQSATHFYSKDLVKWTWTGPDAGVVAGGKEESDTDCPDFRGVYSGSTTIVDGVPHYAYPGVHDNPIPWTDGKHYTTMSQCTAVPANSSDPTLSQWKKRTIINASQIPHGVRQHFHDDSEAFIGPDGRWWMFCGTAACPGNKPATGDCPYPDPTADSAYGVNYLFSSADFKTWKQEHSLVNTSGFVSCPEFYTLPNMEKNKYIYHSMNSVTEVGTFDVSKVTFTPDGTSTGKYDNADGHAAKSYWDAHTGRRIMWAWIAGSFPCVNADHRPCDSMQSVPREITYDTALDALIINPVAEVAGLRTGLIKQVSAVAVPPVPKVVPGAKGTTLDVTVNFTCNTTAQRENALAPVTCGAAIRLRTTESGSGYFQVGFQGTTNSPGQAVDVIVSMEETLQDTSTVPAMRVRGPTDYTVSNNTNFPKGDIRDVSLPPGTSGATGVALCEQHCDNTSGCHAWVFVEEGHENGPRCALKGSNYCAPSADDNCAGCRDSSTMKCFCISGEQHGAHPANSSSCGTAPPHPPKARGFQVPFAATESFDGSFNFRILVDKCVIEVYAQHGRAIGTYMYLPNNASADGISLLASTPSVGITASLEVYSMGSAYEST